MRSWTRLQAAFAAAVLATVVAGVPPATADQVDDQRRRVNQIADELDALDNQLGQLEEAHAAALDRIDQLEIEIQDAQVRVDAQSTQLATLQGQLADIALNKFMSGGATGLTPLFSSAEGFVDDLERDQLARVALDQGAGTSDEMQALVEELTADKASLDQKKAEQAQLVSSLETQQQQGEALTIELQQKYKAAEAELGQAIIDEQARRAAEAAAAAQARFAAAAASQQAANTSTSGGSRGGGGQPAAGSSGSGSTSGSGSSGSGSTAAPAPAAPAPSVPAPASTAGIAVSAAQGQLGVPYKFAASSPGVAFDCSGLTKYAWGKAGVYLPHQSASQYATTPHVPKDQAQPGDLIFYYSPIGHVAIYLGGGMMIHAPATGDVVKVSPVNWGKVVGVSRPG
jgi:peptidoglycan DL-endopeptidase CwlO